MFLARHSSPCFLLSIYPLLINRFSLEGEQARLYWILVDDPTIFLSILTKSVLSRQRDCSSTSTSLSLRHTHTHTYTYTMHHMVFSSSTITISVTMIFSTIVGTAHLAVLRRHHCRIHCRHASPHHPFQSVSNQLHP